MPKIIGGNGLHFCQELLRPFMYIFMPSITSSSKPSKSMTHSTILNVTNCVPYFNPQNVRAVSNCLLFRIYGNV